MFILKITMVENISNFFINTNEEKDLVLLIQELSRKKLYYTVFEICSHFKYFINNCTFLLLFSDAAFEIGEHATSFNIIKKLLTFRNFNIEEISMLLHNKHKTIKKINNNYVDYNLNKVNEINQRKCSPQKQKIIPLITFSITTCKRIDLFKNTINSFINCCEDIELISEWICIDDNSSLSDRDEMKKLYPFFTFYFKNIDEKGHPKSMNIIKNLVKTPFIFHMEDDWNFIEKREYIKECLEVLAQNKNIGQCLINKNYAETGDIIIKGGDLQITKSGLRYHIHEYVNTRELELQWHKKHGYGSNCNYWPHFSFRPSLIKTKIYETIGDFDESAPHFEMEYSFRYFNKGFVSAFLEDIYCVHTGRLTSEREDKTKSNAYTLNNENQFEKK
jgi:hypothetical protein